MSSDLKFSVIIEEIFVFLDFVPRSLTILVVIYFLLFESCQRKVHELMQYILQFKKHVLRNRVAVL
jgi:hypothetical protein